MLNQIPDSLHLRTMARNRVLAPLFESVVVYLPL